MAIIYNNYTLYTDVQVKCFMKKFAKNRKFFSFYFERLENHMHEDNKNLFQMGEVTKALGITRRMLINYENLGLVKPALKEGERGFRYYSADNIVHIRLIRTLQNLGLSLPEIRSYFDDTTRLDEQIERLVHLRSRLDQYIAQLRLRQAHADTSEMEVHNVTLPGFTGFFREFHDADLTQKTQELRLTYIDAMRQCRLDNNSKMCIQVSTESDCDGLYIVPVAPESAGFEIRDFPQAAAICIYYRGCYENFPQIHKRLLDYAAENGLTPNGYFRNIYMEGPPTHGANKDAYVTQIALPIKFAKTE